MEAVKVGVGKKRGEFFFSPSSPPPPLSRKKKKKGEISSIFTHPYASCVLEGPGTHCASANSSANTDVVSHLLFPPSVNRRMNWATCAEGPPKAVHPRRPKSRARAAQVAGRTSGVEGEEEGTSSAAAVAEVGAVPFEAAAAAAAAAAADEAPRPAVFSLPRPPPSSGGASSFPISSEEEGAGFLPVGEEVFRACER